MRSQLMKINAFFETLPDLVKKYRIVMWLIMTGVTVFAIAGIGKFKIDMSADVLFEPGEPVKVAYDRFRAVFGSDEVFYLVYEARDGDVFSATSLQTLHELHKELEDKWHSSGDGQETPLCHITEITSLINVSFLEGREDALISRDFIGDDIPVTTNESEIKRNEALKYPDYPRILCSEDSRFSAIVIRTNFNAEIVQKHSGAAPVDIAENDFDFNSNDDRDYESPLDGDIPTFKTTMMHEYVPFRKSIYEIINKAEYTRNFIFYPAGNPELMGFIGQELQKEMGLIIIGSLVLILLVTGFLFRSFSLVFWSFLIVILTVLWTIGTIGWSGIAMNDFINIIIFLLIAVGVADAIHIMSGYLFFRKQGEDHKAAIRSVYRKSGFACFLTSLTTAAGLLALNFAPIVAIQRLAYFGACGVMYAFFITVFMLPLVLDMLKPKIRTAKQNSPNKIQWLLSQFNNFSTRNSGRVILLFLLIAIFFIPGIFRIKVDSNVLTIIRENRPIRKNFDIVDKNMAGTGNFEILVDTGVPDGLKDPLVLQSMDSFQQQLERDFSDIVYKTMSLANVTKNSYKALNEERQEMHVIPGDPAVLGQTLFLFEGANPTDRRRLVTDDYRAARITVNTRNLGSYEGLRFMNDVNRIVERQFRNVKNRYPNARIEATGQIPLFLRMMDLISWSQIQSFGISLVVIAVILLLVLNTIRSGLIAIIPNLFPIMAVFGVMGWLRIPLDVHTLLVVPIIIGISVDDTIHFVTHFHLEMRKYNNVLLAISTAMREAGQAIIFTSVVLAIGYLVFLVCVNKGFAYFGFLSSLAVIFALLADLILLPALLSFRSRDTRI